MDAVTGDPIAFLGDSAATFQQLELDVAGSASFHSGRLVSLREIRSRIDIRYGFDAVNDTLFGRPTKDFITQTVGDMQAGADRWLRRHAQGVGGTPYRTLQEHAQQFALEGAHARGITAIDAGPLPVTSEAAGLQSSRFQAAMDAEFTVNATGAQSPSAGMRVAGSMALASVAADATYTVKRAYELSAAGNHVGTDSTVLHFGSRNLSAWGGAVLGAQTGAALGFETGPGAILTTAVGGIAGRRRRKQDRRCHRHLPHLPPGRPRRPYLESGPGKARARLDAARLRRTAARPRAGAAEDPDAYGKSRTGQ